MHGFSNRARRQRFSPMCSIARLDGSRSGTPLSRLRPPPGPLTACTVLRHGRRWPRRPPRRAACTPATCRSNRATSGFWGTPPGLIPFGPPRLLSSPRGARAGQMVKPSLFRGPVALGPRTAGRAGRSYNCGRCESLRTMVLLTLCEASTSETFALHVDSETLANSRSRSFIVIGASARSAADGRAPDLLRALDAARTRLPPSLTTRPVVDPLPRPRQDLRLRSASAAGPVAPGRRRPARQTPRGLLL